MDFEFVEFWLSCWVLERFKFFGDDWFCGFYLLLIFGVNPLSGHESEDVVLKMEIWFVSRWSEEEEEDGNEGRRKIKEMMRENM